ncbi:MAG TPA: AI-2E family transporter [Vicinamibacterales bacterium]|nr:AI-2E family transporter [Vicinamibacterales bacterium]
MTTRSVDEARALIRYAILMTALAGIVLWCAYIVRDVLLIVYVSIVLAIGFSPIVRIIERQRISVTKRFPRWLAILVLYLAILGTIALVVMLVFPPLVRQAQALWEKLPEMFERAQQFLISKGWLKEHLTMREAVERAPGGGGDAVGQVARTAASLAGGIFGVFTILILTFYMLVDSWALRESALRLLPKKHRARADAASRVVMVKVSAWLGGQLLLAGTIGATSAIGLWALGIPFFYVLALISAVGEMIPIVGPFLAAIPAIAVASTVSLQKVIVVIVFFVVQQQLENHILVPKIMSRQVGVSPVTVIVSLLIGGSLLGVVGALLAVPTAAILQVIAAEVLSDEELVSEK